MLGCGRLSKAFDAVRTDVGGCPFPVMMTDVLYVYRGMTMDDEARFKVYDALTMAADAAYTGNMERAREEARKALEDMEVDT